MERLNELIDMKQLISSTLEYYKEASQKLDKFDQNFYNDIQLTLLNQE